MKWMLIAMVLGKEPVKTNLIYDSLDDCMKAEELMRSEYAAHYNKWLEWAKKHPKESGYPDDRFQINQMASGICIPHAPLND